MLNEEQVENLAQAYLAAEAGRHRTRAGSVLHSGFTVEDAYAVQKRCIELKVAAGAVVMGHKIGMTSRAMQRAMQIAEPDHGVLLDDMFYRSGSEIPMSRFIEPKVECEIAFKLGRRLSGPNCTVFDVLAATEYIVPCIEIVDSRTHRVDPENQQTRKILDVIADNAGNAALVFGGRPVKPDAVDLRWISAVLYRNAVVEETGVAAAVLDHPANGVAWLANKISAFGVAMDAGQFILAGSFTAVVSASQGDVFHADYGPLGSIAFRFV